MVWLLILVAGAALVGLGWMIDKFIDQLGPLDIDDTL